MTNEFDYYMVESDGAYQSPALMCDDDVDPEGIRYLFLTGQVFSRKIYDVLNR
jgi:hypothetical protein